MTVDSGEIHVTAFLSEAGRRTILFETDRDWQERTTRLQAVIEALPAHHDLDLLSGEEFARVTAEVRQRLEQALQAEYCNLLE